jgi:error-prone DNA polymerase
VRFHPIDVQQSDWLCRVEADGAIRLGFMYVNGLRKEAGQAMAQIPKGPLSDHANNVRAGFSRPECPKCGSDDDSMIEVVREGIRDQGSGMQSTGAANHQHPRVADPRSRIPTRTYFCNTCAHEWTVSLPSVGRFASIEQVVQRTGLRRDELTTLADIGALNAFTHERRSALWQVERAVRPGGELFRDPGSGIRDPFVPDGGRERFERDERSEQLERSERSERLERSERAERSPLPIMDDHQRLRADYAGMGLTIGPHPMSLRRDDLALRGVLRAVDLPQARDGRRVRVAGMVITRQRPGTAKGFVFLTLEDETGISNVIVRPDLFDRERTTVIRQPFLLVEGVLQHQDGVLSVKAERLQAIEGGASVDAHDFY